MITTIGGWLLWIFGGLRYQPKASPHIEPDLINYETMSEEKTLPYGFMHYSPNRENDGMMCIKDSHNNKITCRYGTIAYVVRGNELHVAFGIYNPSDSNPTDPNQKPLIFNKAEGRMQALEKLKQGKILKEATGKTINIPFGSANDFHVKQYIERFLLHPMNVHCLDFSNCW